MNQESREKVNGEVVGKPETHWLLDDVAELEAKAASFEIQQRATPASKRGRWGSAKAIALLIAVFGLGVGITRFANPFAGSNPSAQVNVIEVDTLQVDPVESYQITRTYTGRVTALRASELGFERSGELVQVKVDQGDPVTAGTAIAQLDTRNLEAKRAELLAQKARAVAVLSELNNGPRREEIDAARATIRDLEEQLALAEIRRTRRKHLYEEGAIAKEQYDEVAFGANALAERLAAAHANLEELLNGTRPEQITAQQALVQQLDARIADIEISIAKSMIKAPFSGTIAARRIDEGAVVEAGQPVVRLVEAGQREVEVGVPVAIANQLTPGTTQQIQIAQTSYSATVTALLPEVDPATRTRTVVLRLAPAATPFVAPEQIARLEVVETQPTNGYWLPTSALVRGERGLWSSYVLIEADPPESWGDLADNSPLYRIEQRDLEVLHSESDRALVRGTLNPGEVVVAKGTQRIVPGQYVRPGA